MKILSEKDGVVEYELMEGKSVYVKTVKDASDPFISVMIYGEPNASHNIPCYDNPLYLGILVGDIFIKTKERFKDKCNSYAFTGMNCEGYRGKIRLEYNYRPDATPEGESPITFDMFNAMLHTALVLGIDDVVIVDKVKEMKKSIKSLVENNTDGTQSIKDISTDENDKFFDECIENPKIIREHILDSLWNTNPSITVHRSQHITDRELEDILLTIKWGNYAANKEYYDSLNK